jgi:predicted ribonuclease YlaK
VTEGALWAQIRIKTKGLELTADDYAADDVVKILKSVRFSMVQSSSKSNARTESRGGQSTLRAQKRRLLYNTLRTASGCNRMSSRYK